MDDGLELVGEVKLGVGGGRGGLESRGRLEAELKHRLALPHASG